MTDDSLRTLLMVAKLANSASHEINNPLPVIMGNVTMLGDAVGADPAAAARLARIKDAVGRIRDVVGRLTQITRLEIDTALQDPAERLRLPDPRD
jgi:signal transduction histidine kinase